MASAPDRERFEERAIEHLLDFRRKRDVQVRKVSDTGVFLDCPSFEARIPIVEDGDKTGAIALMRLAGRGEFQEVRMPYCGRILPFLVESIGGMNDGELVLQLRLAERA